MNKSELTPARLRQLLHYDPGAGEFRWRADMRPDVRAGDIAGCRMRSEYWTIHIDGRNYRAHQLAWLYMKGEWGRPLIDHRDGNPLNNRWRNLCLASPANNAATRPRLPGDTSGFSGISFDRRSGNWTAQINRDGRGYFLGRYATVQEAHEAYAMAARKPTQSSRPPGGPQCTAADPCEAAPARPIRMCTGRAGQPERRMRRVRAGRSVARLKEAAISGRPGTLRIRLQKGHSHGYLTGLGGGGWPVEYRLWRRAQIGRVI